MSLFLKSFNPLSYFYSRVINPGDKMRYVTATGFNPLSYFYSRVITELDIDVMFDDGVFQSPIVFLQSGHVYLIVTKGSFITRFNPLSYFYSRVMVKYNELPLSNIRFNPLSYFYSRVIQQPNQVHGVQHHVKFQSPIVFLQSGHV